MPKYILIFCFLPFFLVSCRRNTEDPDIPVKEISLSFTELDLEIGEESLLTASVSPLDATDPSVTWSSSSPLIVSVMEGRVKALAEGSSVITARAGNVQASCLVTVSKPFVPVSSVKLDRRSMVLSVGLSKKIEVVVEPADATDPSVTWISSSPTVVSVSEDGTVTALTEGTAMISATAGQAKVSCQVSAVSEGADNTEIWYTSWTGSALHFGSEEGCGAHLKSNAYSDGKGVLTFDGDVTCIPTSLFNGNSGLKTVSLPQTVQTISLEAFKDCSALLSVTIQEGVTRIGGNAFQGCNSLRKLQMPSTVTSIGSFILQGSSLVTTLLIPENVLSIDTFSLYGCSGLSGITVLGERPASLGFRALDETNNCPIYVPAAALDTYKKADGWKDYASRIQAMKE